MKDNPAWPPTPAAVVALNPVTVRMADAVRISGLSRSRLYLLIKADEIEILKVGRNTLVVVESLLGYLDRCRASGTVR